MQTRASSATVDAWANTGLASHGADQKEGMEMLLGGGRGRNRIKAGITLAAVLVMVMASPAGAAGWVEERDGVGDVYQHILAWLGLAPRLGITLKEEDGATIDPNGAHKRASVEPSRRARSMSLTVSDMADEGPHTGPNGRF
jgi:hypothetical protein